LKQNQIDSFPLSKSFNAETLSIPSEDLPYSLPISDLPGTTSSQRLRTTPHEDDYLPVGILRRNDQIDHQSPKSRRFPDAELASLEKHGWVKLSWHEYESHPGWSFVQIHVLPHDVGRNLIPRTSNALRKSLKLVMSSIDKSPAAFNGQFEPISSEQEKDAAGDESLWYIFNTLDNPNPVIENVHDADGRLAMEELMSSSTAYDTNARMSYGVFGLKTPLHPYQCRSAATMIQREAHPKQMLDPRLQTYTTPHGEEYYYDKEDAILLREKRLYSEACGGEYPLCYYLKV
jgi:hypothetical protein